MANPTFNKRDFLRKIDHERLAEYIHSLRKSFFSKTSPEEISIIEIGDKGIPTKRNTKTKELDSQTIGKELQDFLAGCRRYNTLPQQKL